MHSAPHSHAHSYRDVESLCCYFSFLAQDQVPRSAHSNQWVGEREGEEMKGKMREKIRAKCTTAWEEKASYSPMNNKMVKVDLQRINLLEE